jgi:protein-S-isoprenylcysteine O-methyltransferase Ste14
MTRQTAGVSDRPIVQQHEAAAVSDRARWRIENWLLGGSILFWSLVGLSDADPLLSPVRLAAAALGASVGLLIIRRSAASRRGTWRTAAAALPSVAMGLVATQLAPQPDRWPLVAQGIFVVGCGVAIASFLTLGRSFAVLPAVRAIITGGPYRIVRHPAYVGELLLAASCLAAAPSPLSGGLVLLAIGLTMLRIGVEERLLGSDPAYAAYAVRVRYRLLPGVW